MSIMSLIGAVGALSFMSSLVAADVIKAGETITVANSATETGSPVTADDPLIGREIIRTVYAGQPISAANTRSPLLVKRNQLVTLKYVSGPLEITTTGRALSAAGKNEAVTVVNVQSRQVVTGRVQPDGTVLTQ